MLAARAHRPPPLLVDDARALDQLVPDLASARVLGIDTESSFGRAYRPRVCLIQLSTEGRDYVLDPLSGVSLAPLAASLADPAKVKVIHDLRSDLIPLRRNLGFILRGAFDTQIACAALGMGMAGLAALLRQRFGVELDKRLQRSDWAQRPLTDAQIRYAAEDSRFLLPLHRELRGELEARRRLRIVLEQCARIESARPVEERSFAPEGYLDLPRARALGAKSLRVLEELYAFREEAAVEADRPPTSILSDEALVEVARRRPRDESSLRRAHPRGRRDVLARIAPGVFEAIRRAESLPPHPPVAPKGRTGAAGEEEEGTAAFGPGNRALLESLKAWRRGKAASLGMEAWLVLAPRAISDIAAALPASAADLDALDEVLPWQRDDFGEEILAMSRSFRR